MCCVAQLVLASLALYLRAIQKQNWKLTVHNTIILWILLTEQYKYRANMFHKLGQRQRVEVVLASILIEYGSSARIGMCW